MSETTTDTPGSASPGGTTLRTPRRYATPVDIAKYGPYGPGRGFPKGQGFQRPRYPFRGRITASGDSGYLAEPGRYHLYVSWGCPWAQRTAIVRKLKKLEDVVSLSYVDDERDARGWAFRERRGPDPVNGFTFLAEAYEATQPGFDGHISVPVLWDRRTNKIVSNNFADMTIDLGRGFDAWGDASLDLYPIELRAEIDVMNERVYGTVNNGTYRVAGATTPEEYEKLRHDLIATFEYLDERLRDRRFLFGSVITEADIRLWPTLARFDLGYNPLGKISERRLADFSHLWAYARDLYRVPAFRETTDFEVISAFGRATPTFFSGGSWRISVEPHAADWEPPPGRESLG